MEDLDVLKVLRDLPLVLTLVLAVWKITPVWIAERDKQRTWASEESEKTREEIRRLSEAVSIIHTDIQRILEIAREDG